MFTETATKHLWQYATEDMHKRAYYEILESCGGDIDCAKKQAVKGLFSYWKVLIDVEYKTKKLGISKTRCTSSTTSLCLDKHYMNIDLKQYREELWTCFEDFLLAIDYDMAVELANEFDMKIDKKKLKAMGKL